MNSILFRLLAASVSLVILASGCSEKNGTQSAARLKGKLTIKGSNTVGEELAPHLIAAYKSVQPDVIVEIESKGTETGLQSLFAKQCDIAAASRVINNGELMQATTNRLDLDMHTIGSYSFAVIVDAKNSVTNLSREQIRDIFTGKVKNWKEVGGSDLPITPYVRHASSGTRLGFRELAMENQDYAPDAKAITNYAGIVEAVAKDPGGIGYCSLDLMAKTGVKPVAVRGTAPSMLAVNEARYPFARILRFYTLADAPSEIAQDFISFVQSAAGQKIVADMGYVPRP